MMNDRNGRTFWRRLRRSFAGHGAPDYDETEEYVEEITDRLTEQGYLNHEEAGMIRKVVDFRERTAAEIMIPRTEILAVSTEDSFEAVLDKIRVRSHSRIPVYEGTMDNIVGILYTKDLLKLWGKPVKHGEHLRLLKPPTIVPEGKPAADLLAKFKTDRVHIAIVIDEYGSTSGLVTLEDVLEEIFGEIQDEYDQEEELVSPLKDNTYLVDARLPIEQALDMFNLPEPEPDDERDYDTLGGFLSYLSGRIPRRGEELSYGDRRFHIESANNRRVFKVRVSKEEPPEADRKDAAGEAQS